MPPPCPVCDSPDTSTFFELTDMPVSIGIQWPSAEQARNCVRGNLSLGFCGRCGFVWNHAFDPTRVEYSQRYDNSLDFSSVFQTYARGLAQRLIDTYNIRGKEVVEIGCGKGHFLSLLCEEGDNRGVGFDPSYEGSRIHSPAANRITYVQDFYGEAYAKYRGDLICCRHVLEHIQDPVTFLSTVRKTVIGQPAPIVYFEVPNVRFILEKLSIWDVIYEHCSYFGVESTAHVFQRCGFDVVRVAETYDGQFVAIEAQPTAPSAPPVQPSMHTAARLADRVKRFSREVCLRSQQWQTRLGQFVQDGKRVAVWGGGSKAVSFLNMLKTDGAIRYVVDINPYKQGRYLPGTGQELVAPSFLKHYRPDVVILMNPIYHAEVRAHLEELGVRAAILNA